MSSIALRPTFDLDLGVSRDEAAHRLGAIIGAGNGPITGQTVGHHLMLSVAPRDRRIWSPWLTIEILDPPGQRADERPRTCRVHARFHPHPSVWTAVMLGYLALATIAAFAAVFGAAQLLLDGPPTALWVLPACALGALAIWALAKLGQHLARDQMDLLASAVQRALLEDEHAPAAR